MTDEKCSLSHAAENTSGVKHNCCDSKQKQKPTNNQIKHRNSSLSLRENRLNRDKKYKMMSKYCELVQIKA